MSTPSPLYTAQGIALGTLLGSLAGGVVLLWLNYRALGYPALANRVAVGGLAVYVVVVTVASLLPESPWLALAFIALQTVVAYGIAQTLQGGAIRYHLAHGGARHSLVKAAGVGFLAGLGVMLVLLLVTSLLGISTITPDGAGA